jgi:EXLDI family protein
MTGENLAMPNRTIYVADADVPLFEKAQQLAGGNLSAAIARALHRFVEEQTMKNEGFSEVTVEVGNKTASSLKRFYGRVLARGRVLDQNETRRISYTIYQTQKGKLAVYMKDTPNWNYWSQRPKRSRQDYEKAAWIDWSGESSEYRLDIYENVDELEFNVPPELFEAAKQALRGEEGGVEFLDI